MLFYDYVKCNDFMQRWMERQRMIAMKNNGLNVGEAVVRFNEPSQVKIVCVLKEYLEQFSAKNEVLSNSQRNCQLLMAVLFLNFILSYIQIYGALRCLNCEDEDSVVRFQTAFQEDAKMKCHIERKYLDIHCYLLSYDHRKSS